MSRTVGSIFTNGGVFIEYIECQTGSHQSPINIDQQPLATTHQPTFEGYDRVMPGNFFNWDFGPAFTPHHPTDELKDLPSMTFDGQKVFMIGWHIHMPSEHLVNGTRSRGEIHLVHANEEGEESAVIGIRLEVASREENTPSRFISQLPEGQFIHYNDTTQLEGVTINHQLAIEEVGRLERYWTYTGSLTTPPCHEGLRWFLPEQPLLVSDAQMVQLLAVSRFSHRVTQEIWLHDINL